MGGLDRQYGFGPGQANSEQREPLLELFKGRILWSGILLASLGHMGAFSGRGLNKLDSPRRWARWNNVTG